MLNVFIPASKKSRASAPAPSLLAYPSVLSGFVIGDPDATTPGWTLTASPAVWSEVDGVVEATGQWWDLNTDLPLAADGQLTLLVTASHLAQYAVICWKATGTRNGVATEALGGERIQVLAQWAKPPTCLLGKSAAISGSFLPGATLTRPSMTWYDALSSSGIPMTVVGTWYKNGAATSSHGPTYSDTVQGDYIVYKEVATSAGGTATSPTFGRDVSRFIAHYISENLPQYAVLVSGKPSGAAGMNVFSTSVHETATYVRNVNSWAAPLTPQLTGCVAAKSWAGSNNSGPWNNQYGGVMITPRHVLYCQHAHPHAAGTWGVNPSAGPCRLRFVKVDNSVVEVVQLCQNNTPTLTTLAQYEADRALRPWEVVRNPRLSSGQLIHDYFDLSVGLVDVDVTTLGIPVMPILRQPNDFDQELHGLTQPTFAISQDGRWGGVAPTPVGNYPAPNLPMTWIGVESDRDSVCTPYKYATWNSDSGTPSFMLHRGTVYLDRIITTAYTTPSGVVAGSDESLSFINWAIGAVDAAAVAMGRLTNPTGLSVVGIALTD